MDNGLSRRLLIGLISAYILIYLILNIGTYLV